MHNYATNPTASPASSDLSSASSWWGSEGMPGGTPRSMTSVSSGSDGFNEGPSDACIPRLHAQGHIYFPGMVVPRPLVTRPPHNPSKSEYIALSTQYVFAAPHIPILARVCIVDYRGNVLYDTFVRPVSQVEDLRSSITGLSPEDLLSVEAMVIPAVREQVSALFHDKIIVGHSLWIHFSLLGAKHPAVDTRDVALFLPFHRSVSSPTVTPLKSLVSHLMRRKIGRTYENPLEEARAALDLFRSYEDPWEDEIRTGGWPSALPPSDFSHLYS